MSYIVKGGVLSYPQLFVAKIPPNAKEGQEAVYSCVVLIPNNVDITDLQKACFNLAHEKWGDKAEDLIKASLQGQPNGIKWPFRKDVLKRDGSKRYDDTKYKCFINVKSKTEPGKVDRYVGADGKPLKITQPSNSKLYAGAVVNVSVQPYSFDKNGNRGIALGLVNIQHWEDGDRLDNRPAAEDEFFGEQRPTADLGSLPEENASSSAPVVGAKGSKLQDLFA